MKKEKNIRNVELVERNGKTINILVDEEYLDNVGDEFSFIVSIEKTKCGNLIGYFPLHNNKMKTKFTLSGSISNKKRYKEIGWEFDKTNDEVYMMVDKEINLNEGDRVLIDYYRIVEWKSIDVLKGIIEYIIRIE